MNEKQSLKEKVLALIDKSDSKVNPFSLSTIDAEGYPSIRMMGIFFRDGLDIYLNSRCPSKKLDQIEKNPKISLFFHSPGYTELLSYFGTAELVEVPEERARAWERFPEALRKYHSGPQSPNLAIIRIEPVRLEYTDRQNKQGAITLLP
ncbi:MAG TPA: pyridoxamine 5'-phosphate oxidase family protein [Chroococcales cyanobacterium]|jgi:general stress protein 26